jgi:hypothetical protein
MSLSVLIEGIGEGITAAKQRLSPIVDAIGDVRRGGYIRGKREILNNSRE